MKLESEIQNSIMTRYFYYQLVNIYVIVGLGGINIGDQLLLILRHPQTLVRLLGGTIPAVSLYFCNLVIVKIFTAVPIEMLRPWQLSTILAIGTFMDRRKTTRRELRTGAFYAWPMLYGWIYPQLMMVQMIVITYSSICPLLMPLGVLFFIFAYIMYKYQLLYVYVNDYQSHGFMWYAHSLTHSLIHSLTHSRQVPSVQLFNYWFVVCHLHLTWVSRSALDRGHRRWSLLPAAAATGLHRLLLEF
jgi:hypothetical protein